MAGGTTNTFFPFLQCPFLQDVLPILIEMMAVLAGESGFGMTIVRKRDPRPPLSLKDL
jgi:hypothetical protein